MRKKEGKRERPKRGDGSRERCVVRKIESESGGRNLEANEEKPKFLASDVLKFNFFFRKAKVLNFLNLTLKVIYKK